MDLAELQARVARGESETLELKRSTGQRSEAMQTLCAMLNHRGGSVLFGVASDGTILGQQVSDHTVEEVAQEIQHIEPPVFPRIERVEVGSDLQVLAVTVEAGASQPYTFKGRAYKRVGNTNQRMSADEYHRMLLERLHGERRWEAEAAEKWTVDDLDVTEITRTVEEAIRRGRLEDPGTRAPLDLLRGLGLLQDNQPLRAAVVLFGQRQRLEAEFPQCMLRLAKFRGTDKSEFLDNRQVYGHAFDLLFHAQRFLRENLPVAGRVQSDHFERKDDPIYPPVALREALANALCHRDYSLGGGSVAVAIYQDRLEITSSGPLRFGLTPEKLFQPHESWPWNPLIARVFYRRGIVEAWGRGTLKMAELMQQAGLPPPQIEEQAGCVLVRFRPSRDIPSLQVKHNLTARQRKILDLLATKGRCSRKQISKELAQPELSVRDDLERLRGLGLVQTSGHGRGATWYLHQG
jgi:ATP-dependent DNA helicase RecG